MKRTRQSGNAAGLILCLGMLAGCSGGGTPDTTPPAVVATTPAANAATVGVGSGIQAVFSEPVRSDTVNSGTFRVETGGTTVSGNYTVSGNTARFVPLGGLALGTSYTVILTTGIRDLAGNPLAAQVVWQFSTATLATIDLRWTPSRARAVNAPGGGYKVYYSTTPGFVTGPGATEIDIPWPGNGNTPASARVSLPAGTYYFKVMAYSALGSGGSQSLPSAELSVTIR